MSDADLRRALGAYRDRLSRDPRDVDALNRLGNLLAAAGQLAAGQSAYERALALRPDIAQLHFNLGNLLQRRGDHAAARDCFSRAVALQPDHADACNNLGNTLQELGDIDAAISAYERAIAARPGFAELHNNLGLALRKLERHVDAADAFSRALAIKPDYALAHVNLGLALRSLERPGEALACFERALELTPGAANLWCFKGAAYLEKGDAAAARDALERSLALEPANRAALAYRVAATQELGEKPSPPLLFDPDRHVAACDVEPPARYGSLSAFNAALAAHVRSHPSLSYQRGGHATRRGAHTGNLLSGDKGPAADLEAIVAEYVRNYLANPPMDPAHPYARTALPGWRLVAWAVIMDSGGHQIPHIHPAGWLSGVYYVRLPGCVGESAEEHAGWIEFGRPPDSLNCKSEPQTRQICPREGWLLLFPSYYYHHTVPFESDEQRISIAFDVLPPP
ncbi:MAG TPA: tetratricopeptide repeat protein [Gammaproteobacteria bacterium]|nr:tetratricopeptide repeat protein [Gammaproteobacteria bacterium]